MNKFIPINGGKLIAELLKDGRWHKKHEVREDFKRKIPPECFARRRKNLRLNDEASFKHWLFANHVRYLELHEHVVREWPERPRGNTPWRIRITDKGLALLKSRAKE